MNSEQRQTALVSLIMLIATISLGWITFGESEVMPISDSGALVPVPQSEQDVVARLWEDPLEAIQPEVNKPRVAPAKGKKAPPPSHPIAGLRDLIVQRLGEGNVSIMVVPVPGTPYPDDKETRLRLRYALQIALSTNDFVPIARNYLGFVSVARDLTSELNAQGKAVHIPYEWFASETKDSVVVLWLPEETLDKAPLRRLAALSRQLVPDKQRETAAFKGMFIIGPRASDTLKKVVEDDLPAELQTVLQGKFAIMSPQATAANIVEGEKSSDGKRSAIAAALAKKIDGSAAKNSGTGYFHNFIATDEQLGERLADELLNRGITFDRSHQILVLSEADTLYGRTLPKAFQQALKNRKSDTPIVISRYLRGLDKHKGRSDAEKGAGRPAIASPEESLAQTLTRRASPATGESQLDYVERLAEQVSNRPDNPTKVVAVLGSDIYDKLVLLRALRPIFPDAVFVTTDLDARLWHPSHLPFTRNLIVASSYNVTLKRTEAGVEIPPYRDCYQVAVHRAMQSALAMTKGAPPVSGADQPLLFEIGRNGAVQLPLPHADGTTDSSGAAKARFEVRNYVGLGGLVLLLVVIGVFFFPQENPASSVGHYIGFSFIGIGALLVLIAFFEHRPGTERWSYKDGTSSWPTEICRAIVIASVISGIRWSWLQYKASTKRIRSLFKINDTPAAPGSPKTVVAAHIFNQYVDRTQLRPRFRRALGWGLGYAAFGSGLLFLIDGGVPETPHIRGEAARMFDMIMLGTSVFAFLTLLFYVLDAVRSTTRLFRMLSEDATVWPLDLLQEKEAKHGVSGDALAGFLDVRFVAEKSQDTGRIILLPLAIQLLFIFSRNSYFDNWTWPTGLIVIFSCNILLALGAWYILRRCAKKIRDAALEEIDEQCALKSGEAEAPTREVRKNLTTLKRLIAEEHRGAYARFFQDPALLAVMVPSGLLGIVVVLFRAMFGQL